MDELLALAETLPRHSFAAGDVLLVDGNPVDSLFVLIDEPQSFFVTKANHLEPNEEARAREWGGRLGLSLESLQH